MKANVMTGADLRGDNGKITLNGKEYHLEYDMNAMCDIEEKYGTFDAAMKKMSSMDSNKPIMKDLRFMFWKALQHSEPEMTEQQAGQMITMHNLNEVMMAVNAAMSTSQPDSEKNGDEKNAENPQETEVSRG